MAITTANTKLYYSTGEDTWALLTPITSYPDMGASPNKIDSTDLSETVMKTNILGLQEAPDLSFEANYDKTAYLLIKTLAGVDQDFKLEFGEAGAEGIFTWTGQVTVYASGAGVDEARKMMVEVSASTEISVA